MGKILLILSALGLLFLGVGTAKAPSVAMFWLASGSLLFQTLRSIMITFLLAHILTSPPRHLWFRLISGLTAMATAFWAVQATYAFIMPAMDTLAFLGASTALLVAAIERRVVPTSVLTLSKRTQPA